jgi:hypothetical protein
MQAMNANRPPADVANEVLASFPSFRAQLQSTAGADDFWDFMMQDQETRESISPLVRPQLKRYLRAIAASVQQTAN